MLTVEQQEQARQERMNEVGTEPPCPFCGRLRVSRSDYIRCNPCGVNWLMEEMHLLDYLGRDPRVCRREVVRMANTQPPIADKKAEGVE